MLIYLDLCAIQRPLDDQSQLRVQLETLAVGSVIDFCRAGRANLAYSDALIDEADRCLDADRRTFSGTVFAVCTVHQPTTVAVEARMGTLMSAGFGLFDALHLASAEACGANFLCTCDDKFLRKGRAAAVPPFRVLSPLELVTELNL